MTLFHGFIGGIGSYDVRKTSLEVDTQVEAMTRFRQMLPAHEALLATIEDGEEETDLVEFFMRNGYFEIRRLPDGTWAFLKRLMFTTAICVGGDKIVAYIHRYCYEDDSLVLPEIDALQELDDEPQGWIARRPEYKT